MHNSNHWWHIVLLTGVLTVIGCTSSDRDTSVGCDEEILLFFDMEPSDGEGIGCQMHLIKRLQEDILGRRSVVYYVGNHCADIAAIPFDCSLEEAKDNWFEDILISEEIIGVGR